MWHLFILKNPVAKNEIKPQKRELFWNSDNSKCYLVCFEDEKEELKIRKLRNVGFNENEFYFKIRKHKNWSKALIMI